MKQKLCKMENCNKPVHAKGLCGMHYTRLRKYGDPKYKKPIEHSKNICTIDGCDNPVNSFGLCNKHYLRFRKYGDPEYTIRRPPEKHGRRQSAEYNTWTAMRARCNNKNNQAYNRYGGRGIIVCSRWENSFKAFYKDMGKKPFYGAGIDRINNDGNYDPNNCRWTDVTTNNRNRRSTRLNIEIVETIRREYKKGGITHRGLSIKYKISKSHITAILNYKKWKPE